MITDIFNLKPNDYFEFNGEIYRVIRFFKRRMPTINHAVLHCEVREKITGNIQWFTKNIEVKKIV